MAATGNISKVVDTVPFCEPFVCFELKDNSNSSQFGYESATALWSCMPRYCRWRMQAFVIGILMLAVFTTLLNVIIIAANLASSTRRMLRRNPTMQNYSNYVISLSLADLMMGIIVLPLAVTFFYFQVTSKQHVSLALNSSSSNFKIEHHSSTNTSNYITSTLETQGQRLNATSFSSSAEQFSAEQNFKDETEDFSGSQKIKILKDCLGIFTHLSIFVSMYTLAAASADRFYISTKPISNRSFRLSRSSFRRLTHNNSLENGDQATLDVSRSTVSVVIIWIAGTLFAATPFIPFVEASFYSVGHVYVAVSFKSNFVLSYVWYIAALALPLVVTWLFSFLLCTVLWRRKHKLRKVSRHAVRHEFSDKRFAEKDHESSFVQTSRYSNVESPVVGFIINNTSDTNTRTDNKQLSGVPDVVSDKSTQPCDVVPNEEKEEAVPSRLTLCKSVVLKKRPRSFDSSLMGSKLEMELTNVKSTETNGSFSGDVLAEPEHKLLKRYSFEEGVSASYVARRLLCRRSWGSSTGENEYPAKQNSNSSPLLDNRSDNVRNSCPSTRSPSATPSPSIIRKEDSSRCSRASTRRRRSSVYRAREFLRSKSFESNIAKTLFAVVVTFSVAVLPLLVVLCLLSSGQKSLNITGNDEVTAIVSTVTILLSNSFWNCLIYGARMPYFRRAVLQIFRRVVREKMSFSCGKFVSRRISFNTSSYR